LAHRAQRVGDLLQWVASADVRPEPARAEMLGQFRLVAPGVLRTVFGESADFHPAQENPLEEHEVERDGGDLGTCETEADETPAPRGGTERRFAVGTTDRVDHHVGAASGEL